MKATERNNIKAEANISDCGNYRYWLSRVWDESKNIGVFICINPSKATSLMSDLTLSNCNNLTVQWGWGGFYIINLFAYRATNQKELKSQPECIRVGLLNNKVISHVAGIADQIILAWGNDYKKRSKDVLKLLEGKPLYCIEKNKGGGYLHPSRIKTENYLHPELV